MELTKLRNRIIASCKGSKKDLDSILDLAAKEGSLYPFNEFELLSSYLLSHKYLSLENYLEIREEYQKSNPYLSLFEISAPRGFGEAFAQSHLLQYSKKLLKPSKSLDKKYSGEYDYWMNGIKIEVKASRVVDSESKAPLYMKALSRRTTRPFLMNFQQLKPQCCDVFIWMAVYRDDIVIWVINSNWVASSTLFSKGQHRGNRGNEGQLHITDQNIHSLDEFILKDSIEKAIQREFNRK